MPAGAGSQWGDKLAGVEWIPSFGALVLSAISLVFSWLGHRRGRRADKRADAQEELAKAQEARLERYERTEQVRFVAEPAHDGYVLRHTGTARARWLDFDMSTLGAWEVHSASGTSHLDPGDIMRLGISPNRFGVMPDSVRLTWKEPFQGAQIVPLPGRPSGGTETTSTPTGQEL